MIKKYKIALLYSLIILLQVFTILYWARCKENYHVDELYSMRYAKGFAGGLDDAYYITDSPEFKFNEWINNSVLKSYLIIYPGDRVFDMSLRVVIRKMITGKAYWGLLNFAESLLGFQFVSVIPGVFLNIIFFIIFQISFLCLLRNLGMSLNTRYLCLAMVGFSGYILSLSVYIRFYMFAMMLMIILLNCFYHLWISETWRQVFLWELLMLTAAYFSYKNCEFFIPFIGAYFLFFIIAMILRKKKKQLFINLVLSVLAIVYVITNTILIKVLIHPNEYIGIYDQYARKARNIHEITFDRVREALVWLYQLFRDLFFGSYGVLCFSVGAIVAFLVLYSIFNGCKVWKLRKIELSDDSVFVFVLVGVTLIYTVFVILGEFVIWRYYCYAFLSISIVVWYVIDRLLKRIDADQFRKAFISIVATVVMINIVVPFCSRNLPVIYEEDQEFIDSIRNNRFIDVILYVNTDDGLISQFDTYDCINMISSEQKIYFVDFGKKDYDKSDYPPVFILWSLCDNDMTKTTEDLARSGYTVDYIGKDHYSQAFFCKKQ